MRKTFLEFFAGIGLMRLGLERGGWQAVWANDIDAAKRRMYLEHFADAASHFTLGDVHQLDPATLPDALLATASFPCNDLSLAGARAGIRTGGQSSAYWGFTDTLRRLGARRPPLVLLENVPGFLSSHGGRDFHDALLALNELGYAVDAHLLDAVNFVPQSRQRLFVFGVREAATARRRPTLARAAASVLFPSHTRSADLVRFMVNRPDVRWRWREWPEFPPRTTTLRDLVEDVPASSPQWWSAERVEYLVSQMSPRHRAIADAMRAGGEVCYGTVFRRVRECRSMAELRTDGIAGCLRTPRGGSGRQILVVAGRGEFAARLLNARECARLMGADDFRISAPLNQALFGFGDAVCVPVIAWIAQHYLDRALEELGLAGAGAAIENASV